MVSFFFYFQKEKLICRYRDERIVKFLVKANGYFSEKKKP